MEEYLKDSPSDYNSNNPSNTTSTPNFNYTGTNANSNYSTIPANINGYPMTLDNVTAGESTGQPIHGYPTNSGNEFLSTNSYYNNNNNNTSFQTGNNNYVNDPNVFSGPSSLNNEPFFDDIGANFQANTASFQNTLPIQNSMQQQFINPANTSTNLDELISPQNNNTSFLASDNFSNSQYFSPPNRPVSYNALDSIPENSINNNALSPISRHGSIAVPGTLNAPDFNTGSYLSPQANPQYLSPTNYESFDPLRSPPLNGNFLNSPPVTQQILGNVANNFSTSIPINSTLKAETLSPPSSSNLSSSVPSGGASHLTNRDVNPKQLTKEEKMKRRREFHNAVERRRRDLIKEKIKELGLIVPPSLLNPQLSAVQTLQRNSLMNSSEINDLISTIKVKETKPNKSTILNKSVDYIKHLDYVLRQQQKERESLEESIRALENGTNNSANDYYPTPAQELPVQGQSTASLQNVGQFGQIENFDPDDFFTDILTNTNVNENEFI
ncbi:bHLH/Zip transcription factor [Scheffersomyces xylosifermentans]|uniref:bHLH/Zip transcription factor n=1 Tax=Scheffersomyces xylosifermentans TaxID=1304137 RepID=UPI00315D22FD